MVLRTAPHGEDPGGIGGGDASSEHGALPRAKGRPIRFSSGPALGNSPASPPGNGKQFVGATGRGSYRGGENSAFKNDKVQGDFDQIENKAQAEAEDDGAEEDEAPEIDFLKLVREAENTSSRYVSQVNKRAWTQGYRAYNNQHFVGSKYGRTDWHNRSKFFRPKTRTAVKKDMAAVAASLFGNIDAVSCMAGNEADPRQRAAAAVMEELINYRTDRTSGKAALPWFQVAMGARQDALIAGVCLSKQYWLFEVRKSGTEKVEIVDEETGEPQTAERDVYAVEKDRPDSALIPPENYTMDPAADWRDPIQSAAYIIIKWPMHLHEVRKKQDSPINPWRDVSSSILLANSDSGTTDTSAIRRSRELGLDRMDETQTGTEFQIIWVYEVYMRYEGEDYTFFSAGDREYLTYPEPVREVYPEQFGERPLAFGVGNLDAHRIFPMSPVDSWQQHQGMLNDIANLRLDATKQNIMPVTKVVRGKAVDLDQVKRRTYGSVVMVNDATDVTFDRPTDVPQSVAEMSHEVELELDDLAGQVNGQTAQNNNALSRTLGGLKLVAGAANAVQEFDIRVWIETWTTTALAQLVRLEQYYEHDETVLGLCGDRAQLFEKYGVSEITDDLIEEEIGIRVSVGLGAGDPQQRLAKFSQVLQIVAPIVAQAPEFQRGEKEINTEEIFNYVFGAGGFRDGGARFFKKGTPQPKDPLTDLKAEQLKSVIKKNDQTGRASLITAIAAAAKQALGERMAEDEQVNTLVGRIMEAIDMGHQHGQTHNQTMLSAMDHGHRHGMAIRGQQHQESQPQIAPGGGGSSGGGGPPTAMAGDEDMGGGASGGAPAPMGGPPPGPQPGGGPPPSGPQGGPPGGQQPDESEPVQQSYMAKEAAGEPPPPPSGQPSPQQQQIDQLRQKSRYIEFVRHPQTNQIMGMHLHEQPPATPPPSAPPGPPPLPPFVR